MIKVAGKWVSPKEVEDVLMRHEGVKECAVIGRQDEAGLLKTYAFVTPHDEGALEGEASEALTSSLMAHLSERLDRYKLPKSIALRADFKRTHLGKIDRGALR
jgi:benzoate-CoA ligase